MDRYVTAQTVCANLGISKVTLWRWVKERKFPAPIRIGDRKIAFRLSEVTAWETERERVTYADASAEA